MCVLPFKRGMNIEPPQFGPRRRGFSFCTALAGAACFLAPGFRDLYLEHCHIHFLRLLCSKATILFARRPGNVVTCCPGIHISSHVNHMHIACFFCCAVAPCLRIAVGGEWFAALHQSGSTRCSSRGDLVPNRVAKPQCSRIAHLLWHARCTLAKGWASSGRPSFLFGLKGS